LLLQIVWETKNKQPDEAYESSLFSSRMMKGRTPSLKSGGPSSGEKFVGIRHFDVTASFSGLVVVRLPKPLSQQQQEVEDYRD
jgi:hypothetical protein